MDQQEGDDIILTEEERLFVISLLEPDHILEDQEAAHSINKEEEVFVEFDEEERLFVDGLLVQEDKEEATLVQEEVAHKEEATLEALLMMDDEQEDHYDDPRLFQIMRDFEKQLVHVQEPPLTTSSDITSDHSSLPTTPTSVLSAATSVLSAAGSKRKTPSPRTCWTVEEHLLFLQGVKAHGWGSWKLISENFLPARTQYQLASHAQKFKLHQERPTAKRRRKSSSIYDIVSTNY